MHRLRLVLADFDVHYVDKLTEYIHSVYSPKIKVAAFTDIGKLKNYLEYSNERFDVILAHLGFINELTGLNRYAELILALFDGSIASQSQDYLYINKFQPGDKLVNQIVEIYAEGNSKAADIATGFKNAKLVSIYSASGGSGKTSVCLGLASRLTEMGYEVLCLSLESINSMVFALSPGDTAGMSGILVNLTENPDKFTLKVEMLKTRDPRFHIDFIEPPKAFLELSELNNEDLRDLLIKLKNMGKYDVILLDMDSSATDKTISVFDCSDKVILVVTPDCVCRFKTASFLEQMNQYGLTDETSLFEKTILLENKSNFKDETDYGSYGLEIMATIPLMKGIWEERSSCCNFDSSRDFINKLTGLANLII